ncbi:hypothetical protein [Hymenobacter rubripertinctus]|uniref:Uncharacterized protein n=1 Tax=Hymenobacter rubripertinctus TaxID=2029981 RepID=A0A418QMF4_9BACT|nr:hypothetical protein [Hymenobacter rubripertinctus]RIY06375.1 hypothetical protein D0T11_18945 [Hymenobacter rubripertinctus]
MKIIGTSLLLAAGLLFGQCSSEKVAPKLDYDKVSQAIMAQLVPQLTGTWKLGRVHVQAQRLNAGQAEIGIRRDTVFQNFAVLTIRPAKVPASSLPNPQYPDFEGDLTFQGKEYPVRFAPLASPDRVVNGQGPHAFFLLQFNLAPGSYPPDAGRTYLEDIGFINDNFTLEMLAGEQTMLWRGLSRGMVKIELQKQ